MYLERPAVLLLILPAAFMIYRYSSEPKRKLLIASRITLIFFLLLALSGPYDLKETPGEGKPEILYLVDSTRSMELYSPVVLNETLNTELRGNTTPLGDAILQLMRKDGSIVLYTDGYANEGRSLTDIAALAVKLGTTLYAVAPRVEKDEVWLEVKGPSTAIVDTETVHEIVLRKLGGKARYTLEVYVDEELALKEEITQVDPEISITLRRNFSTLGGHRIQAVIHPSSGDHYPENNVYYKSVSVVSKPRILFISSKPSPLPKALRRNYMVHLQRAGNLSSYDVVLLNNVPFYALRDEVNAIADYVREGGGLVVIGGDSSYNRGGYRNSPLEVYLPVTSLRSERGREDLALLIAIDMSAWGAAAFGNYTKAAVEKAIAVGLIKDLKPTHYLGVIAFDIRPYVIANLSNTHDLRELEEKIARLLVADTSTSILNAQAVADKMLSSFPGSKNLIILTDGWVRIGEESRAIEMAGLMAKRGIRTYTVGVGYSNDEFLSALATRGQGVYFKQEEEERLKLIFGEEEEESFSLRVLDTNHFITRGLSLQGSVAGFNEVTPKRSARVLVTTGNGDPVLAVWRFGLGRVASLTTDDGTKWAPELYEGGNSRLLSAVINWASGSRRKEIVSTADAYLGMPVVVSAIAPPPLPLKLGNATLTFEGVAPGEYRSIYHPEKPGFYTLEGGGVKEVVAVNYPLELLRLGFNPELEALVRATGGRILKEEELPGLEEEIRKTGYEKYDETLPFILTAMMLFLTEVTIRRYKEVKK